MTKKTEAKIRRQLARHIRERELGGRHYSKSDEALQKARELGLPVNHPVELTIAGPDGEAKTELFELRDNFAGESAFRTARVPHFELKKVPRGPRSKKSAETEGGAE